MCISLWAFFKSSKLFCRPHTHQAPMMSPSSSFTLNLLLEHKPVRINYKAALWHQKAVRINCKAVLRYPQPVRINYKASLWYLKAVRINCKAACKASLWYLKPVRISYKASLWYRPIRMMYHTPSSL
jgi:hypothetical protein